MNPVGPKHPGPDLVLHHRNALDAGERQHQVVREPVGDREVIVDAVGRAHLVAAGAAGAQRIGVDDPGDQVQRMNALLDNEVAGERQHVIPTAQLLLGRRRRHAASAARPRIPGLGHDERPHRALVNLPDRLAKMLIGAGLEIHQEHLLLRRGALARRGNRLAAGRIHRDRLGQIDMLARVHGGGGVYRVEIGRRLDDHRVELAFQQPLVARQPRVTARRVDLVLLAHGIGFVLEVVRAGHQPILAGIGEQLGNPTAASAAADQANLQHRVGLRAKDQRGFQDGEGGGGGGARRGTPAGEFEECCLSWADCGWNGRQIKPAGRPLPSRLKQALTGPPLPGVGPRQLPARGEGEDETGAVEHGPESGGIFGVTAQPDRLVLGGRMWPDERAVPRRRDCPQWRAGPARAQEQPGEPIGLAGGSRDDLDELMRHVLVAVLDLVDAHEHLLAHRRHAELAGVEAGDDRLALRGRGRHADEAEVVADFAPGTLGALARTMV